MSYLCTVLRCGSLLQRSYKVTKWNFIPVTNTRTLLIPIKMAAEVFKAKSINPDAPPLMVMHGFLESKKGLRKICKRLSKETKRKIYNLDARNHGESPHIASHSSAHMAEDIAFMMSEEKLKRVSIMGHSMGGRTMMFFAINFPELVEKAVIIDISPISVPRNIKSMEDIFNAIKNMNISPKLSANEGREYAREILNKAVKDKDSVEFIILNLRKLPSGEFVWRTNIEGLSANAKQFRITQYFTDMEPFRGPALFIAGKQSVFVNPNDWEKIQAIFPNAELKWLDAGHWVHLDQEEEFIAVVAEFLNKDEKSNQEK